MISVEQLLDKKGHRVWSISPEDSVYNAIKLMNEKRVGALAVIHQDSILVGIISERDYACKVVLEGRTSRDTRVKDIMSTKVIHTSPDREISECLVLMNKHRIRHLPVMKDDGMVGMLSMGDVVKEIIEDQQYTIKQLENYISWEESY